MSLSTPAERLEPVLTWIDAHRDAAVASLQRFCRQPSISAQNKGMQDMAELVAESLRELGAETSLVPTQGFPVIVGQLAGERPHRLAIYDHYDVQPPDPLEAWSVPPFEVTLLDGRLTARGVADNKGNLVARLWAVRAWQEVHGTLPCGVTFLVESEEEIGSPSLGAFARAHQDLLQADGCLWEAGACNERGTITITAGLKGLLSVELRVQTVAYDLHSSNAPLAPSAAWRLVEALGSLHEPSGRVRIPGFYDAVRPPTEAERSLLARFPIETPVLRQSWQIDQLLGPGDDPVVLTEHLLYAPTCNICGIWGGYQGPGGKTVLPATAGAKLDFRLVPDQEPGIILTLLERHHVVRFLCTLSVETPRRPFITPWEGTMAVDISVTLQLTSPPLQQIAKANTATFEAQGFSWGADNATTIGSAPGGAGAGKAKFAEAIFTKSADHVASPVLFQLLVTGEHLGTVTIEVRKAGAAGPGASTPEVLATITLSLVFITHFGQSASGSDEGLQETINLAYGAAQMTINGTDATGKSTTGVPATWSQITNSQNIGAMPLAGEA